jgi:hypothetical protein
LILYYVRKLSCKSEILWYCGSLNTGHHILFLHFCDYPPFEEDLALHLNKTCKNGLYQVWLKLARCFILKDSFLYSHVKNSFPSCGPSQPLGTKTCTSLNLHCVRKLYVNLIYSRLVVPEEKIFQLPHPIFHFWDYLPLNENLAFHLDNF